MTTDQVNNFLKKLGKDLKHHREEVYKMSVTDLARKSGVSRETIYRMEAGEGSTVANLVLVMDAFGLIKGGKMDVD